MKLQKEDVSLSQDIEIHEQLPNLFDSPLEVLQLCYPDLTRSQAEKKVDLYKRRAYNRYVHGDTSNLTTYQLLKKAIKASHYSSMELDILIKYNIEQDFREELFEMYDISMTIIDSNSISDMNKMKKELTLIEDAYGRRVYAQPEELTDKTLYKNKTDYQLDYKFKHNLDYSPR